MNKKDRLKMKTETMNKLMSVGLTEEQGGTIGTYITELLDEQKKDYNFNTKERMNTKQILIILNNYDLTDVEKIDLLKELLKEENEL
jgi:uncharacterized protein (DUF1015 family)